MALAAARTGAARLRAGAAVGHHRLHRGDLARRPRPVAGRSADVVLYLLLATTALTACACCPAAVATARRRRRRPALAQPDRPAPPDLPRRRDARPVEPRVYYAFGTLYWQRLGIADSWIAALWAEGDVVEIAAVLFRAPVWCAAAGRRWDCWRSAAAPAMVRWSDDGFRHLGAGTGAGAAAPRADLRRGASWVRCTYLARHVPPAYARDGAVDLFRDVGGIGFGIASLVAGALYGAFGGRRLSRDGGDGRAARRWRLARPQRALFVVDDQRIIQDRCRRYVLGDQALA